MSGTTTPGPGILVFAPHPDDETLGCGWVILRAAQAGVHVHIAVLTNGDGFPLATATALKKDPNALAPSDYLELGRRRQQEVLAAVALLGLTPDDVSFLAYPDSCLDQIYKAAGDTIITQQFTQQSQTYGLAAQDYHTRVHGAPARYQRHAVLDDVAELIRTFQPGQIYVTDAADTHLDHAAAFWLVRDAANAAGWSGELYTYLIHSGDLLDWPWPSRMTPSAPFESHVVEGTPIPGGLAWPPDVRIPMTHDQALAKFRVIQAYSAHVEIPEEKAYLEAFVKSEEIFWRR